MFDVCLHYDKFQIQDIHHRKIANCGGVGFLIFNLFKM